MPKEEWGLKRVCPSCASRFYDLQRDPMTCPSCGASFSVESLTAGKPRAARMEKAKPETADADDEVEVIDTGDDVIDTDADDDILEDDDDSVDLEEIADVPAEDEES